MGAGRQGTVARPCPITANRSSLSQLAPRPRSRGAPGCLEVINYTIWQRNTTRFIAESATDGPESKTRISAEMSKCWPRTVGDGVCTCVCVCVCVHAGRERICGWGLRLCHFFRDYHKADTHPPITTMEYFLIDSPPSAGKDWGFGCQGVCVGREKCKWGDWEK